MNDVTFSNDAKKEAKGAEEDNDNIMKSVASDDNIIHQTPNWKKTNVQS